MRVSSITYNDGATWTFTKDPGEQTLGEDEEPDELSERK